MSAEPRSVASARTPPASWYTDPARPAFERERLFMRTWQYCGPASALAEPGASVQVRVAGHPVIVVNDPDSGVTAWYSVCQHRGGPLTVRCGDAGAFFQCRYHGWTYNLDGSLRGTPQFDRGPGFDPDGHGLHRVRCTVWEGLVFVCLDERAPPLDEFLAGITELVGPLTVGGNIHHLREVHPVACNWKVYVDNYLEAYHVPLVHPEYAKSLDYKNYREEVHGWWSVQRSGFAGGPGYYGAFGEATELFYFMLWPNTMVNLAAGRLQVNQVSPVGHDRCEVVFDYFYDDATSEAALAAIEEDVRVSHRIQAEDAEICAKVQEGLASPAYESGCYSMKRERALHAYHALLREWCGPS